MGVYDYLGTTQVKCFYEPVMNYLLTPTQYDMKKDSKSLPFDIWFMHGRLKEYRSLQKIPYKTLYYNYGKSFMVFDPSNVEGTQLVHIIQMGRYIMSVEWCKLNTILHPIRLVVDKTGQPLNIHHKKDFGKILTDYTTYQHIYQNIIKAYYKNEDNPDSTSVSNIIYMQDTAFKPFTQRWINNNGNICDPTEIGAFLSLISENICHTTDNLLQDCVKKYIGYLGDEDVLTDNITKYGEWAKTNRLRISEQDLAQFFYNPSIENFKPLMLGCTVYLIH